VNRDLGVGSIWFGEVDWPDSWAVGWIDGKKSESEFSGGTRNGTGSFEQIEG